MKSAQRKTDQARDTSLVSKLVGMVPRAPAADATAVQRHIDSLTKPRGSLGQLESIALRLALIYGDPPPPLDNAVIFVLAADHGVAARGVSAYPPEVTAQMCKNYASGGAAISVFARAVAARVVVADFGVNADLSAIPGIEHVKILRGTRDLSQSRALTIAEVRRAIVQGAELFTRQLPAPDIVAIGEMGIGNTTAASAMTALLTGADAAAVVGRGTGVDDATLARKRSIVEEAVARVPRDAGALRVLGEVGGLEIAGLVGVILAAAAARRAIILDGFISTAAALASVRLCPAVGPFLVASHRSREIGHAVQLDALGLHGFLDLGMRLGEASGAALAIPTLRAAALMLRDMATFESAGVSRGGH